MLGLMHNIKGKHRTKVTNKTKVYYINTNNIYYRQGILCLDFMSYCLLIKAFVRKTIQLEVYSQLYFEMFPMHFRSWQWRRPESGACGSTDLAMEVCSQDLLESVCCWRVQTARAATSRNATQQSQWKYTQRPKWNQLCCHGRLVDQTLIW